jgi:hypothetical protein
VCLTGNLHHRVRFGDPKATSHITAHLVILSQHAAIAAGLILALKLQVAQLIVDVSNGTKCDNTCVWQVTL